MAHMWAKIESAAAWLTTPHSLWEGGWGVLDGSVPGTPTQEVKPCMGSMDGGGSVELYPLEANTWAQRLSILTCSAPALISWVSNAPSFCPSAKLFRNYNSSKSCCDAENMHWQDYCHLISSKYQNRDGKINIVHALCVKTDSTVLLNDIWLKLRESPVKQISFKLLWGNMFSCLKRFFFFKKKKKKCSSSWRCGSNVQPPHPLTATL